jgi:plastocyanin
MRLLRSAIRPRAALAGLLLALLWLALLVPATPATAHGPTVRLAYGRVQPPTVTVEVGQTVHFHNASTSGAPVTVVALDGSFESPTLGRAEGWHYTFETPGDHPYRIREAAGSEGLVRVVPK